ncbi:plasminogen activator inhibitor 1-like [Leguminivora glycinivorella]|uniref:plasminogen activator inhibitor 1-like n=1 Tax=Leguminivora glycinivorella TaxID=1035111 RepID=UPI00200EF75E|nr:plasminogen activator inhibitor 1-like [Leguminivora glycinivorella]
MDWRSRVFLFLMFISVAISDNEGNTTDPSVTEHPLEQQLSHTINEFGYKLLTEEMKRNAATNIVMSPTGIAGLLAMVLLGSAGNTYTQLATSLGFSKDVLRNRAHHEQFGTLLQLVNSSTAYADAIFVEPRVRIRPLYREFLQRVYRGDARNVEFSNMSVARNTVNEWIKNHTKGKIEEFLKEPLPIDTKVVLLSALYFSGQWAHPFLPEHTKKMAFKAPTGDVMADMMLNFGQFQYIYSAEDGVQMIALPYKDTTTTMYVLKPLKKLSLPDLMSRLNYSRIDQLIGNMTINERAIIRFPKMDLKNSIHLEKSLKTIGLSEMFAPTANFALMIDTDKDHSDEELLTRIIFEDKSQHIKDAVNGLPNPGVHVDTVLHEVRITIDEFGTEAVAATGGFLSRTAEQFYVDSPFYMFIRDESSKLVTFSAAIFNPTL